ncbi:hypothetical protein [Methylobacterium segetis]|uniref:hypothetical protein n=1 Tax=Methylobacterium segetis TaxID=2488750 RepID=UPI001050AC43|nr:hypothetical protein [Methylobacterium segetis]
MPLPPVPIVAQAAAFTLGCALIHTFRRYPERVTQVLAAIAFVLFLVLVVALIPAEVLEQESAGEAGASIASAME